MIDRIGYLTADEVAEFVAAPVATQLSGTFQPLSNTLTGLAGTPSTLGVLEQTATQVFGIRAIGVGSGTALLTRADGDARYLASGSNASTATKLQTARTIGISGAVTGTATSFDGSANITIPITALDVGAATAGTLSIARGGTGGTTQTTARTALGLGTMSTQDASAVNITGGSIYLPNKGTFPYATGWGAFGSTYEPPSLGKTADGMIVMQGSAQNSGSGTSNVAILPSGFRPTNDRFFGAVVNGAPGVIKISSAGVVEIISGPSSGWVSVELCFYP